MTETFTITLTPYRAALLDAACRSAGVSLKAILPGYIKTSLEVPGEEVVTDGRVILEHLLDTTQPEPDPETLPVSDFYKDIV